MYVYDRYNKKLNYFYKILINKYIRERMGFYSVLITDSKNKLYYILRKPNQDEEERFKRGISEMNMNDMIFMYSEKDKCYIGYGNVTFHKITRITNNEDKLPFKKNFHQYKIDFKWNKVNLIPISINEQGYFKPTQSIPIKELNYGKEFLKKIKDSIKKA